MADIKFDIGEAEIRNAIAVALAESFGPEKRDSILRDVIRTHLQVKLNTYDKETILGRFVGDMLRRIAQEEIAKIIQNNREQFESVIEKTLGVAFVSTLLKSLQNACQQAAVSNLVVHLEVLKDNK